VAQKKSLRLPALSTTLVPAQEGDELELDEMWSWVLRRRNKRWLWLALCRRTRQVVAYALGCRGAATCRVLWQRIPASYKTSLCYSDFWAAYTQVVPAPQHDRSEGRGQTNHPPKGHPSATITPSANGWGAWFAKRCLFPSVILCMKPPSNSSSTTTIKQKYLLEPLP